jgi:hypothetical protein
MNDSAPQFWPSTILKSAGTVNKEGSGSARTMFVRCRQSVACKVIVGVGEDDYGALPHLIAKIFPTGEFCGAIYHNLGPGRCLRFSALRMLHLWFLARMPVSKVQLLASRFFVAACTSSDCSSVMELRESS